LTTFVRRIGDRCAATAEQVERICHQPRFKMASAPGALAARSLIAALVIARDPGHDLLRVAPTDVGYELDRRPPPQDGRHPGMMRDYNIAILALRPLEPDRLSHPDIVPGRAQSQPTVEDDARKIALTEQIHDCDRRLGQYQAVLDEGADAKVVARWMAQVHRERANLQTQLGHTIPGGKLTSSQVRALVDALRDIVAVLADADPQDKADLYGELGVNLTYHPEGRVSVAMHPRGINVRVGGATATPSTRDPWEAWLAAG
jgi:hypothetical protein